MKNLKRICAATLLSIVLTLPGFAGDMLTGAVGNPPPPANQPAATSTANTTSANTESSGDTSNATASLDPITEAVLGLLQGILALF